MGTLKQVRRRWTILCVFVVAVILVWINVTWPQPKAVEADLSTFYRVTPVAVAPLWGKQPVEFYVHETMAEMSLEQKIRSLLIINQPGMDVASLQGFVDSQQLGGFILMGSNIPSTPEELSGITAALRGNPELPRLIGIDEEGGEVKRLPYDSFAGADVLRNEPIEATAQAFTSRAQLLKSVGINLNFGVVADVSGDTASFIYGRSFGSDGMSAGIRVEAAVTAENPYLLSTLKHFPGHGSAPGDSHVGIPTSPLDYEYWKQSEGIPFAMGIVAGNPLVMFGHLSFPAIDPVPSSLSQRWHQILREEMGFDGVIITDDMTMLESSGIPEYSDPASNAVEALRAGNDLLLYVPSVNFDVGAIVSAVTNAVTAGTVSAELLDESVARVLTLRRELYSEAKTWIPPCDERCLIWVTY
ncbi:glycoside hydrolase family 3 N-terminal domain-containing protein [Aurantimicrobium sp. MWH-Uga1]|uniref:glycoside hydrolase family 3 N-terminal domain-containing protein n=1 Tax=Aurantimicrobium sp. MWH-Uga1 TaxID=2079575 RepID=UPI000DF05AA0|nr:glycoside hydrolase family 3 N-terminal domain-containing protein [Aurantimicrobium sp. MWH-Uga1]AXE54448.1 putative lipoprotein YbbD precursor [Aurantimicrobium sp. MWH-Uga1]